MITATFLTKVRLLPFSSNQCTNTLTQDLLLDWRLGEKHFMENLVDGDLGSK
jgi:hypothetical protein